MATTKVDKRPAKRNFFYRRGDTVAEPFTMQEGGEPADITGRTYRAQLRRSVGGDVVVAFTVDVLDAEVGQFVLRLTSEQTELLSGTYVWDLEQNDGGVVRTFVGGQWIFDPDVTRDEDE